MTDNKCAIQQFKLGFLYSITPSYEECDQAALDRTESTK